MKLLVPVVLALLGLGAGVGAGLALKPSPEEPEMAMGPCGALETGAHGAQEIGAHGAGEESAAPEGDHDAPDETDPCADVAGVDPFAPGEPVAGGGGHGAEGAHTLFVPLEKPFIVPVFRGEKVVSMVIVSLSVAANVENPDLVHGMEPRLRDRFLEALFLHSNSGGFDGSFTTGRKIEDLKLALLRSAQSVMGKNLVNEVLITEINRQDV
jgi:flagellar protein FliL